MSYLLFICMVVFVYFVTNCVQNNDVELLAGYLSLHQDGDQLSVKWTPNQLMNGCSADVEEPLPTKRYITQNVLKPVHTVAEKCDCRRKRRLSPNSATVAVFCDSRTILRQSHFAATMWTGL